LIRSERHLPSTFADCGYLVILAREITPCTCGQYREPGIAIYRLLLPHLGIRIELICTHSKLYDAQHAYILAKAAAYAGSESTSAYVMHGKYCHRVPPSSMCIC